LESMTFVGLWWFAVQCLHASGDGGC
jgi:hypothetical protein